MSKKQNKPQLKKPRYEKIKVKVERFSKGLLAEAT